MQLTSNWRLQFSLGKYGLTVIGCLVTNQFEVAPYCSYQSLTCLGISSNLIGSLSRSNWTLLNPQGIIYKQFLIQVIIIFICLKIKILVDCEVISKRKTVFKQKQLSLLKVDTTNDILDNFYKKNCNAINAEKIELEYFDNRNRLMSNMEAWEDPHCRP